MQNQKVFTDPDLIAADAALRRAASTAKKLAEQQGIPYVVDQPIQKTTPQSRILNGKPR
ncbi:MAG: hypothetical protein VW548_01110 [Methylotenera sp.]